MQFSETQVDKCLASKRRKAKRKPTEKQLYFIQQIIEDHCARIIQRAVRRRGLLNQDFVVL